MVSPHRASVRCVRTLTAALLCALGLVWSGRAANVPAAARAERNPEFVIRRMADLWELPEMQRGEAYPVCMEIAVNYYDPYWKLLWGWDGSVDAFIPLDSVSARVKSGQRIRVEGTMVPLHGLPLRDARVTVLNESAPLEVLDARGSIGDAARFDARLAVVEGYVNRQLEIDPNHVLLELAVEGRQVPARVLVDRNQPIPQVEGALVRLTCLYVATRDAASPEVKLDLWVASPKQIEVVAWLEADPRFERSATPIDQLPVGVNELVRVAGVVRSQVPGSVVVVRDDTGQVTVKTAMTRSIDPGVQVEALGYPTMDRDERILQQGVYRPARQQGSASPAKPGLMLLRLVDQVRALSVAEAEVGQRLRLNGVVTWSHPGAGFFFMRDASGGIRVNATDAALAIPGMGSRVVVEGVSGLGDFAPVASAHTLRSGDFVPLPEPRAVTLEHAMTGVEEGEWVSLSGYVRALARTGLWTRIELTTSAGEFEAMLPERENGTDLIGSVVKLHGICAAVTNAQRQLTGVRLWVGRAVDITIEEPAPADPFKVPLRTIASLRQFSTLQAVNHRVRVTATVVNHHPGVSIDLQEGAQSLRVLSRSLEVLTPGDRVDAVGFVGRQGSRVVLREAVWRRLAHPGEPAPVPLGSLDELSTEWDGRLVKIEGRLIDAGVQPTGCRLLCESGNIVFEALLHGVESRPAAWNRGSNLSLTGVYEIQRDADARPHALQLSLRSTRDVQVLRRGPWWTVERALVATGVLAVAILLGLYWVNALRRRVASQTALIREQIERAARLETELVRSSKLESLGVLAGGIAHDFNNLLTVVMGNLSLVLTDDRVDSESQGFLRESERAAMRARDLTHQLLTFSKGGAPVRAAVQLSDIVREAAGFAQHGSTVRCEFSFAADLGPANVDKGQIAQVVHNIVINAVQAMPAGGVVHLALHNDDIRHGTPTLAAGPYVRMTISDTGVGMPPDHLARIFDPYFTTKERGSGLGLATVYSIIKKHLGHIEVCSTPGAGTVFRIWLPAATSQPEEPIALSNGATRWAGRVLMMDDEEPIRRFMSTLLERMGFSVTAVADGEAALREYTAAKTAAAPFTLVILDLTIPAAMGGTDTMQHLRVIDPNVRAIVSSGYAKDPVVANYRSYGFCGMMPKPYVVGDVVRVINEVMETALRRCPRAAE